ncbi:hypothetical protein SESBI_42011 [Sesbania bispinosa]|nr:hypothetical protein SESBI_42011 [Sesbania bispinosa]
MDLMELWAIFGPGVAGAVFGAGWWIWLDAVVCSSTTVPFLHYLPGIFASLAALMFNCVRKEDIDYSPYDEGEWRLKLWLFIAYVVSFVSLAGSAGLLIQDSIDKSAPSVWTGVAGVLECVFVLIRRVLNAPNQVAHQPDQNSKTTPHEGAQVSNQDPQSESTAAHGDWLVVTRKKCTANMPKNGKSSGNKALQGSQANKAKSFTFTQGSLFKNNPDMVGAPKITEAGQSSKPWLKKKKPRTSPPQIDITKLLENASKSVVNMADRGKKIIVSSPLDLGASQKPGITSSKAAEPLKNKVESNKPGQLSELDPKPPDPTVLASNLELKNNMVSSESEDEDEEEESDRFSHNDDMEG